MLSHLIHIKSNMIYKCQLWEILNSGYMYGNRYCLHANFYDISEPMLKIIEMSPHQSSPKIKHELVKPVTEN